MKTIRADLPAELQQIVIHPLADLHIGDAQCRFDDIKRDLDYIRDTDGVYCLLDGDLMNAAIVGSVSNIYAESIKPMEALSQCVKIFAPIKHKILAVVGGNHEERFFRTDGIDITQLMCDQLDISDRYSPTTAMVFVRFGHSVEHRDRKMCYSIYMTHGNGGGRKEGGKVQRLADLAGIVDADIYLMAHVHQPASFRTAYYRCDPQNNAVTKVEKLFVNTAAWLDYGGYGDRAGFKPSSCINPEIYLGSVHKSARCLI